jgi:hypothetical protein
MAAWPPLPLAEWRATQETLHRFAQIIGKTRMVLSPPINHWWHTTLRVTARGLAAPLVPYRGGGFDAEIDLVAHRVCVRTTEAATREIPLRPMSVAAFHRAWFATLAELGIEVAIGAGPDEVPDAIPFTEDETHAAYDPVWAHRFWRVLLRANAALQAFRAGFLGKCSPVQFFWGSFDLAVTRFSGHRAPPRPQADWITREAYAHECSSAGFWPGNGGFGEPAFYAYHAPEPPGFRDAPVLPAAARFEPALGEFVLPYEAVRTEADPGAAVQAFLESAYAAGADAAGWDRAALERPPTRTGSVARL